MNVRSGRAARPRTGARARAVVLAGLALAACASDPPPPPPTPLAPLGEARVSFVRDWSARVGESRRGRLEPWVGATRLVVADNEGQVVAFDRESGARLWVTELGLRLGGGVGGDGERVYVATTDALLVALDATSGERLWERPVSSEVLTPPVAAFDTVIVRSVDGRIAALDPASGEERWSVSAVPPPLTLHGYGRPLVIADGVLVGVDDGRVLALDRGTGRTIWEAVLSVPSGRSEVERLIDVDADVAIDGEGIYAVSYQGRLGRLEPARGQLAWAVPLSSAVGLVPVAERIVVVDEEGVVRAFDRAGGRELWSEDALAGRRPGPPAVSPDGRYLLVGDVEGYLHAIDVEGGTLVGRTRAAEEAIAVRPQIAGERVLVQSVDGRLGAYSIAR